MLPSFVLRKDIFFSQATQQSTSKKSTIIESTLKRAAKILISNGEYELPSQVHDWIWRSIWTPD